MNTSIACIDGLIHKKKFCRGCLNWYRENAKHICSISCFTCQRSGCVFAADKKVCDTCNMICRKTDCFTKHKEPILYKRGLQKGTQRLPPPCETNQRCTSCDRVIDITKRSMAEYVCSEWFCKLCKTYISIHHAIVV